MIRSILSCTLPLYALLLMLAAGCAQTGPTREASTLTEPGRPDVYIWPNSNSHSNDEATLRLVVKAGSLQETDEQLGYAHFVEHMAFNGTEAFPKSAIQERLNELGMSIGSHSNAYTTFDHTAYTLELNSVDPQRLESALELLSEWAYSIEFDEQEVRKERPVILEEWRQSQPQEDRIGEKLFQEYFAGSRHLDRRPIGTKESISNATGESLRAFYEKWYHPGNMAVVVAGDFDESEVQSLVNQYFPVNKGSKSTAKPKQYSLNAEAIDDRLTLTDAYTTKGHVELMYMIESQAPTTPAGLLERLKWDAALDIWHDRVQKRLVSTQGAVADANYHWEYPSNELLEISLSASLSQDQLKTGLQLIESERQRLLAEGISQQELDDWRQGVLENERPQQDSAGHLAGEMTEHYVSGWPMIGQQAWVKQLETQLPTFTPEDVRQALADKMNQPAKVLAIHPHNQTPPSNETIDQWLAQATFAPADGEPNSDASAPGTESLDWPIDPAQQGGIVKVRALEADVTEWTLDNGMTVLYRYSDSAPGKVYYTLTGLGGLNTLSEAETINARLALPTLARSGLRDLDGPGLSQWLESQGLAQNPEYNFFNRKMAGSGPTEKFPVLMRLLHVALTEAEIDPAVWEHVLKQNQDHLAQLANHPHKPWIDTVNSVLVQNDIALRSLTEEELARVSPEQMQNVYDEHFAGAQNYRIAIVGDIDRAQVKQSVVSALATLPAKDGNNETPRLYPTAGESTEQHVEGSGQRQASVVLRYGVPKTALDLEPVSPIKTLPQWLNEALMEQIREQDGSVYSIQASVDGQTRYQKNMTLIVQLATDPGKVDEVVAKVETTLKQLAQSGPEPEQIETWHTSRLQDREQALKAAKSQASNLAHAPLFNRSISRAMAVEQPDPATSEQMTTLLEHFISDGALRVELAWLP